MEALQGRTAVVTGAASGIGRAIVERFVGRGHAGRAGRHRAGRAARPRPLRSPSGAPTSSACRPTSPTSRSLRGAAGRGDRERFGNVHVLCNNAGVGPPAEPQLWLNTPNDWRWTFGVNVFGVANGIHVFLPHMVEPRRGRVTSSTRRRPTAASSPCPAPRVYASSKAAVVTMTECLHHQLRALDSRISASVLLPSGGLLLTGLWTADRNRPGRARAGAPPLATGHDRRVASAS